MLQPEKLKVLFLCTGNACRSQMAEGWARRLKPERIEPYSAGILASGLDPNAVKIMAEASVDISGQRSKVVKEVADVPFDYVVTVCGHAHETCPVVFHNAKVVHIGFDDPPWITQNAANDEERMAVYRRVRDEIRDMVANFEERVVKA